MPPLVITFRTKNDTTIKPRTERSTRGRWSFRFSHPKRSRKDEKAGELRLVFSWKRFSIIKFRFLFFPSPNRPASDLKTSRRHVARVEGSNKKRLGPSAELVSVAKRCKGFNFLWSCDDRGGVEGTRRSANGSRWRERTLKHALNLVLDAIQHELANVLEPSTLHKPLLHVLCFDYSENDAMKIIWILMRRSEHGEKGNREYGHESHEERIVRRMAEVERNVSEFEINLNQKTKLE